MINIQTVLYGFGVLVRMRVGVRMHRSVGMDMNVLLRGMHGFRMFHNVSLALRHVLRGNAQHHSFRFPGIELYLDQRVAAHRNDA